MTDTPTAPIDWTGYEDTMQAYATLHALVVGVHIAAWLSRTESTAPIRSLWLAEASLIERYFGGDGTLNALIANGVIWHHPDNGHPGRVVWSIKDGPIRPDAS